MLEVNESKVPYYAVHKDGLIAGFFGPFRFLSNFYVLDEPVIYSFGLYYPSVENAYQAAKWPPEQRDQFTSITSGKAKRLGKNAPGLDTKWWAKNKRSIMRNLCWQKFSRSEKMKRMLLETEGYHLEERNSWSDRDWGTDEYGVGENNLGKILMSIRDELARPSDHF